MGADPTGIQEAAHIARLARRFGTPLYVYDLSVLRQRAAVLRCSLPSGVHLLYSMKANPHPDVVRTLADACDGIEAGSVGEALAAISAGVTAARVLLTGPGRAGEPLGPALAAGVRWVTVESAERLDALQTAASGVERRPIDVLVRIAGAVSAGQPAISMERFGLEPAALTAVATALQVAPGLRWAGVQVFAGSNAREPAALVAAAVQTARVACDELGVHPTWVDVGGGFPHAFGQPGAWEPPADFGAQLAATLESGFQGWRCAAPRMVVESGRALAGPAGTLLLRVTSATHTTGGQSVGVDGGLNAVGGLLAAGRSLAPQLALHAVGVHGAGLPTVVDGPLCTPIDRLAQAALLPPLRSGDLLAVPGMGAYGLTAAPIEFLGLPAPMEVVVDGEQVISASRLTTQRRYEECDDNHNT